MNVIPNPRSASLGAEGAYALPEGKIAIDLGPFSQKSVQAFLDRTGLEASVGADISLSRSEEFAPEEYELTVSAEGVSVKASTDNGVVLALTTLFQLSKDGQIPFSQVRDLPRYGHRGLSFDCARHFFDANEVKRVIEQMSLVKMNTLHWHLTDDQAWRIESKKHPELHLQHNFEYFTQEDIKSVVAFADSRGVEVIPEIDMPGHMSALLSAHPDLSCSGKKVEPATCGGIYPVILCAGNEDVYALIAEILDEICPLFPSGKFHVGGDEAPKREWEKCPRCQQKIKEEGLPDEKALQGYFTNRIIEVLKAKGKTPVCWNESLEAAALDKSSIIQYWMPTGAEATKNWASSGGKFIYSDMFTYYFDYPNSMSKLQRVYEEKLSLGDEDCSDNPGLLGIECCLWTEHIRENKGLEEKLFPRLYAAAEKMWGTNSDYQEFLERLRLFISRFHPADMGLIPEESWNLTGEARLNESLGFLAMMSQSMSPEAKAEVSTSIDPQTLQRAFMEHFFEPADMPFLMRVMQGLLG